ncbi:MAG: hypothetical protein ACJ749_02970 [Flavisolibacter sp.]
MKKVTVIFVLIGILGVAAYLFVSDSLSTPGFNPSNPRDTAMAPKAAETNLDLRPKLIKRIQQLVKKGSNGLYNLSIHEIAPDIINSELNVSGFLLSPDTTAWKELRRTQKLPASVFKITAKNVQIKGIGIKDLLEKDKIDLKTIFISNPVIDVYQQSSSPSEKESGNLYDRLGKQIKHFAVNSITISNGTVITHSAENKISRFNDINIHLSDILVDSTTRYDKSRFLFAKEAELSTKNFAKTTPDNMYDIRIASITVSASKKTAIARNISFHPKYSKQEFGKKAGFMKERYDLSIPSIELENLDWQSILQDNKIVATDAVLNGAQLGIYLDRSLPEGKAKVNNFPSQLLMHLPMKINIARLNAKNVDVIYEEFNPASGQTGRLYAENLNGEVRNITNIESVINKNHTATVTASGILMKGIPASLNFTFDLSRYQTGVFTASLHAKSIEKEIINTVAQPLGMFNIKKGRAEKLEATVRGNVQSASGKVLLLYQDLHITPLEKDNKHPNKLEKRNFTSFLANSLVIKNENPSGNKDPRRVDGSFTHDPHDSFFNLVWKTTFVGILKTIGAPEKLAYQ